MGSQAVVFGAGIAGLLAARVLSEFYGSVTVVERDALPDRPDQRKGVPQGRHLHHFLGRGTQVIGDLFPGILDEFGAAGAVVDDGGDLSRVYISVAGYELKPTGKLADPGPLAAYQASRPFVEFHLRRRVAALGNVTILDNHDGVAPMITGDTVTGAQIINGDNNKATVLKAGLVIDTTGRATRTAHFLDSHGFGVPTEEQIPSVGGYSSQLMHIPSGRITDRLAFVNKGSKAPGALLLAYEHDTWMLAVARPAEYGNPPKDFTEMLAAAADLLPATITAGLRDATPIGALSISRSTAAAWRRYDQMTRLPTGLVVLGDALCNLNPLHGQGMTMASLQVLALRDCLGAGTTELPRRFYRAATEHIGPVWAANRANDHAPSTSAAPTWRQRLRSWTQHAASKAATNDIAVAEPFLRVRSLVEPPTRLQDPALFLRILMTNLRHPHRKRYVAANQPFALVGQKPKTYPNAIDSQAVRRAREEMLGIRYVSRRMRQLLTSIL